MTDPAAGARFRRFMEDRMYAANGWQQELADRAGMSRAMLHRWFAGDAEPSMAALRRLAGAVGVPRFELVRVWDGDVPE